MSQQESTEKKNDSSELCDFQEILEDYVGGWGPYQWKYLIVFAFVTTMLAYVTYSPLMILFVPENYWCTPPPELSNLTLVESQSLYIPLNSSDSKCQMYDVDYAEVLEHYLEGIISTGNESWPRTSCKHGWTYDLSDYFDSASTQLDWVCENDWKGSLSQSLFQVGATIGTLFFGWMADNYGRYKAFLLSNVLLMTTGLLTPICANLHEIAFLIDRFAMGLSFNAFMITFFSLTIEYVSHNRRSFVGTISFAIWLTLGSLHQPWLAKSIGNWKIFNTVLYAQTALIFVAPWFIDESCRWLMSKGRIDEAIEILRKISKVNKKPVDDKIFEKFRNYAINLKKTEDKVHVNWTDLFRTPRLRKHIILMIFTWMMISLVFDGHIRNTVNIDYSFYVSYSIMVSLEFPADLLSLWGLNNIGRRWSASLSLAASSVAMMICGFSIGNNLMSIVFASIGRFFVTYAMTCGSHISMEVAPTVLRGQGNGIANVFAQAATFLAPFLAYSSSTWKPLPFFLLAFCRFLGAISAMFLPETAGKDLPNTVTEAEDFGLGDPFFYMPIIHYKRKNKLQSDDHKI